MEYHAIQHSILIKTAFALTIYRADRGKYPKSLQQLVPDYLREPPIDVWSGRILRYQSSGSEYKLYSVGQNERDDGGRPHQVAEGTDDIVITAPSMLLPRQLK